MIEIRIHGRGGQGTVLASDLLAHAAFLEGREVQSFPFFGVERRGAPVTAYARIADEPIRVRTAVETPDFVIVLDPSLLESIDPARGLRPTGLLLVNSERPPGRVPVSFGGRVATVDGTSIALRWGLGSGTTPIVNTVLLGAFVRVSEVVSLDALVRAIATDVPQNPEGNVAAAREGYAAVRVLEAVIA